MRTLAFLTCLALPAPAMATSLTLELPVGSEVLRDQTSQLDSYALPVGTFADGQLPVLDLQGLVHRGSWSVASQGLTSLQLLDPLQTQLEALGYTILFSCDTQACGGFDFRFETEVLPAPDMHVDLSDFRFLAAQNGDKDHLGLLVSRSANTGFIQMIRVTDAADTDGVIAANTPEGPAEVPDVARLTNSDIASDTVPHLQAQGHVVLEDLSFATGSADLGAGPFASLNSLAAYLKADPSRRVALVGHTDALGTLERNINLSKRRAASVRDRLIAVHGVSSAQLDAEGMGYLAPRGPNLTEEGREANRRVEAVLLNTE
ncbi:OmpA family protein [Thalassovita sp.]|uniref:OmpA family protein n=1 Tax=Thalassovita sp. TaxID=1979401 RepID=UPI002AAF2CAB|nr:OmpA family protein [Thalassovita sp.]